MTLKQWATPLAIGSFLVTGVTGIMLFFHVGGGLSRPVHEWLSWVLVVAVVLHTWVNSRAFTRYFCNRTALAIIMVCALITIATAIPSKGNPGVSIRQVARALEESSLETVCLVAKVPPEKALEKLGTQGILAGATGQTIGDIAAANGKDPAAILAILFR